MSPGRRVTRRALLGTLAGGVGGLAGCGYRAGGGEFRWRTDAFHRVDRMVLDAGTLLLVTRETRAFDFDSEEWYRGGNVETLDPERGDRTAEYGFEAPTLTAAFGEDALYAGREDGTVTAVPLQRDTHDAPASTTPEPCGWTTEPGIDPSGVGVLAAADGDTGRVYAGGSGGLVSVSTDGEVGWRWRDARVLAATPGEDNVAVYALAADRLVAFDDDGSARWDHETTPATVGGERPVPPLVDGDGVYLAAADGVVALAHDGSVRWRRDTGEPVGRPALTDDGLYHASVDGTVRSFSLDGRERWGHEPRGRVRSDVAAADGRGFVLAGGELVGVGPRGTAWRVPLDDPKPFIPEFGPFAVGEAIVLGGPGEVRGYWQSQRPR